MTSDNATAPISGRHGVVVVGAGLAGLTATGALRAGGYRGQITLVGDEACDPYDRPPLSKEVLTGSAEATALPVDWVELAVRRRFACTAVTLADGVLGTSAGEIPFDALVVATGSQPAALPGTEPGANVRFLRTHEDALTLREQLRSQCKVVVIGAGWLGAEVASAAALLGCGVTVVEAEASVLPRVLGTELSGVIEGWYAEAGVQLLLSNPVALVQDQTVALKKGAVLAADVVVVAIGASPNTSWLIDSDVSLDDAGGVLADPMLRATQPGVYAVGDVASYPSRRYGRRMRVEHWTNAQQSGTTAAMNIMGKSVAYDPLPYFWSKQFGRMVQYVGQHRADDELVWRGSAEEDQWSVCWLRDDRVTAVMAVNQPRDLVAARRALQDPRARFDTTILKNPTQAVTAALR